MSFESRIVAFSERFLSDRTVQLIVAPALADLQFDPGRRPLRQIANRLAVLKAVAGGLRGDVTRQSGSFAVLTLLPTCYYVSLLTVCFDSFPTWSAFLAVAATVLVLSLAPAMACFWPGRRPVRPVD